MEEQPDELIYQQCLQMDDQALSRFIRTSTRIRNICNEILEKRKKQFGTTAEQQTRYLLEERAPLLAQQYDRLRDKTDRILVALFVLPQRRAEEYLLQLLNRWKKEVEREKRSQRKLKLVQLKLDLRDLRGLMYEVASFLEDDDDELSSYLQIISGYGVEEEQALQRSRYLGSKIGEFYAQL